MPAPIEIPEDVLARAASTSSTWGEFYSKIGFSARPNTASSQRVRRACQRYGVDTGHLVAQRGPRRSWSDDDLVSCARVSGTWREVVAELGTSYASARKHAERLGIDTSHLDSRSHNRPPVADPLISSISPESLRRASEDLASAWYKLHGFRVLLPEPDSRYDLLVIDSSGVQSRVQVKTGTRRGGSGWSVGLTYGRGSKGGQSWTQHPYTEDDVEEVFVVALDGKMLRIPIEVVSGRVAIIAGKKYGKYEVEMFL